MSCACPTSSPIVRIHWDETERITEIYQFSDLQLRFANASILTPFRILTCNNPYNVSLLLTDTLPANTPILSWLFHTAILQWRLQLNICIEYALPYSTDVDDPDALQGFQNASTIVQWKFQDIIFSTGNRNTNNKQIVNEYTDDNIEPYWFMRYYYIRTLLQFRESLPAGTILRISDPTLHVVPSHLSILFNHFHLNGQLHPLSDSYHTSNPDMTYVTINNNSMQTYGNTYRIEQPPFQTILWDTDATNHVPDPTYTLYISEPPTAEDSEFYVEWVQPIELMFLLEVQATLTTGTKATMFLRTPDGYNFISYSLTWNNAQKQTFRLLIPPMIDVSISNVTMQWGWTFTASGDGNEMIVEQMRLINIVPANLHDDNPSFQTWVLPYQYHVYQGTQFRLKSNAKPLYINNEWDVPGYFSVI